MNEYINAICITVNVVIMLLGVIFIWAPRRRGKR